jgi:putative transposase
VLERLNKEITRRSNAVGIFPSAKSTIRLVGAILLAQDEEWSLAERRYFSAGSMKQLSAPALPPRAQERPAAIA